MKRYIKFICISVLLSGCADKFNSQSQPQLELSKNLTCNKLVCEEDEPVVVMSPPGIFGWINPSGIPSAKQVYPSQPFENPPPKPKPKG
jgi:hypothetical protein